MEKKKKEIVRDSKGRIVKGVAQETNKYGTAGAPSKYEPKYCQMLIDHMSQGLSIEAFAGVADISIDTIYKWVKKHPEFAEAKKTGTAKSRLLWEKAGMQGMYMGGKDTPFNSTIWIFNMKNRFGWKDKHEVSGDPNQPLVVEVKSKALTEFDDE